MQKLNKTVSDRACYMPPFTEITQVKLESHFLDASYTIPEVQEVDEGWD